MNTFSFTVESPDLAQKIHSLITGSTITQLSVSPPLPSSPPPAELPPPGVAPAASPPPVAAAPPSPAAAPPPPVTDDPTDVAPPGWTLDHIKAAAQAFTANPAKGGAAKLQEILGHYVPPGVKPSLTKTIKARWPQLYNELSA